MAAAVARAQAGPQQYPPLRFFYTHFHDSIRLELESLDSVRADLESWTGELEGALVEAKLAQLRERYKFLEQIYKYHSSVEDEVRACVHGVGGARACVRVRVCAHASVACVTLMGMPMPAPCCPCGSTPLLLNVPGPVWRAPRAGFRPSSPQVVYPALDSKVKNVTVAYSVEHQDEVGCARQRAGEVDSWGPCQSPTTLA